MPKKIVSKTPPPVKKKSERSMAYQMKRKANQRRKKNAFKRQAREKAERITKEIMDDIKMMDEEASNNKPNHDSRDTFRQELGNDNLQVEVGTPGAASLLDNAALKAILDSMNNAKDDKDYE